MFLSLEFLVVLVVQIGLAVYTTIQFLRTYSAVSFCWTIALWSLPVAALFNLTIFFNIALGLLLLWLYHRKQALLERIVTHVVKGIAWIKKRWPR